MDKGDVHYLFGSPRFGDNFSSMLTSDSTKYDHFVSRSSQECRNLEDETAIWSTKEEIVIGRLLNRYVFDAHRMSYNLFLEIKCQKNLQVFEKCIHLAKNSKIVQNY